jgi:hypothetical protein
MNRLPEIESIMQETPDLTQRIAIIKCQGFTDHMIEVALQYYQMLRNTDIRRNLKKDYTIEREVLLKKASAIIEKSIFTEWKFQRSRTTLGNATKPLLQKELAVEESLMTGHARNATFYEKLIENLHDDNVAVSQAMSLAQVEGIRNSVFSRQPTAVDEATLEAAGL